MNSADGSVPLPGLSGGMAAARLRLASAEAGLASARGAASAAKTRRKEAKEAARRAKKRMRRAKAELREAKRIVCKMNAARSTDSISVPVKSAEPVKTLKPLFAARQRQPV